jgi:hypothetical protein
MLCSLVKVYAETETDVIDHPGLQRSRGTLALSYEPDIAALDETMVMSVVANAKDR